MGTVRAGVLAVACVLMVACAKSGGNDRSIVVYAAVDREAAQPIFDAFTLNTGIRVTPVYDSEAAKTVGLAAQLEMEKGNPRAHIWWSGESLYTRMLEDKGCFVHGDFVQAEEMHGNGVSTTTFTAQRVVNFAARLRVLCYSKSRWPGDMPPPDSLDVFADPRFKDACVMARPLVGTSATHAASLLATESGEQLLRAIKANGLRLVASNSAAVEAVRRGQALVALTDSDDALLAMAADADLAMVIPDQGEGQRGVVVIASSAGVVRDMATEEAKEFIRYLTGPAGESMLAASSLRSIPMREGAQGPKGLPPLATLRIASVDLNGIAHNWNTLRRTLTDMFGT